VRFCAFDLEDDEASVSDERLPAVREFLAMLRASQSVIDYRITDITRNNAPSCLRWPYEKGSQRDRGRGSHRGRRSALSSKKGRLNTGTPAHGLTNNVGFRSYR
jgi:hypothetical protein